MSKNSTDWTTKYGSSVTLDGTQFGGFKAGDTIKVSNSSDSDGIYTITAGSSTTLNVVDPYQLQLDELNKKFDKIMDRLAILDDPDPEKLEKSKALKKAYEHYKMLEKLAGLDDE